MFLSKTLNIQTIGRGPKLRTERLLDYDAPTSELPRSNSRYTGSRQHPIALVGNHSHRIRQLHLIGYTASNNCQGTGCVTQPTGSETIIGVTRTWGFQQGFYIFTAATILVLIGLVFHQTLTQHRSKGATSNQKRMILC